LAPLPCDPATAGPNCVNGKLTAFDPSSASGDKISGYLNVMIRIFIGLCAVLAVVMIVIGGIEYMTSELVSSKEAGKERIRGAIFGLLLALGAWTLLNQINPDILNTDLNSLKSVTVDVALGGESSAAFVDIKSTLITSTSINCSNNLETTARSFIGNSVYSQTARNTVSEGKAVVDCSSYVDQVYACAGLSNPGNNTTAIFSSGATPITSADLSSLKVGDLLGWKPGDNSAKGKSDGHVLMYIGNGQIIDAQGSGVGVTARPLSPEMQSLIKYIKRAP
jgi:cell wall-associated NlpC family hydrolase